MSHWGIDNANETNRVKKNVVSHNAFPVFETGNTGLLKGLLSKKDLFTLMQDFREPKEKGAKAYRAKS